MTLTVLDNMEYGSDGAAQYSYKSNAIYGGIDEYTVLMLNTDGVDGNTSFSDLSIYNKTVYANGGVQKDTSITKFDSATAVFDGNGDYITLAGTSDFSFGSSDFSIDAWVYMSNASSGDRFIFSSGTSNEFFFGFKGAEIGIGRVNVAWDNLATHGIANDTWAHIAVTRSGSSLRFFVDGNQVGSTFSNSISYPFTHDAFIGAQGTNYYYTGWIYGVRISKGIARYTSSFSVQTSQYSTDGYLQDYSEPSIISEGSYSLKAVAAQTTSLNKTLTRTITSPINLTGYNYIIGKIRSTRTGSNVKIGFHDSGGTTTEITPNITAIDTWQNLQLDISAVPDANKDAIDQIILTVVNADYDNTFYLDMLWAFSGLSEPLFPEESQHIQYLPFKGINRFINYKVY